MNSDWWEIEHLASRRKIVYRAAALRPTSFVVYNPAPSHAAPLAFVRGLHFLIVCPSAHASAAASLLRDLEAAIGAFGPTWHFPDDVREVLNAFRRLGAWGVRIPPDDEGAAARMAVPDSVHDRPAWRAPESPSLNGAADRHAERALGPEAAPSPLDWAEQNRRACALLHRDRKETTP